MKHIILAAVRPDVGIIHRSPSFRVPLCQLADHIRKLILGIRCCGFSDNLKAIGRGHEITFAWGIPPFKPVHRLSRSSQKARFFLSAEFPNSIQQAGTELSFVLHHQDGGVGTLGIFSKLIHKSDPPSTRSAGRTADSQVMALVWHPERFPCT